MVGPSASSPTAHCVTCDVRLHDDSDFFGHLAAEHHLVVSVDDRLVLVELDEEGDRE